MATKIARAGWTDPRRAYQRCRAGLNKRSIIFAQRALLRSYDPHLKRLIIFITPGWNEPRGGVRSIVSIYEETKKLHRLHQSKALLCTIADDELRLKYTWFKNRHYILQLADVMNYFSELEEMLIHVPECYIDRFVAMAKAELMDTLRRIPALRFNILLQNIDLIQDQDVEALKSLGPTTCTTAHQRYSTVETRASLGVPLHHLSVCGGAAQYRYVRYRKKEGLMIVSADEHPEKKRILDTIAANNPHLVVRVIQGIKYTEYLRLVGKAKWCLTFGEGLDHYFIETVFCGGVSFAVYNDRFFTPEFKTLETVYDNLQQLEEKISTDLLRLDHESVFVPYQKRQFEIVSNIYKHAEYCRNVGEFYRGNYSFP